LEPWRVLKDKTVVVSDKTVVVSWYPTKEGDDEPKEQRIQL